MFSDKWQTASVKLESGFISFKNYSKQIPVPFKIYADFECILKKVDGDIDSSYTRKYQDHVPCSVDNKFSKKIVLINLVIIKMLLINLSSQFLMTAIIV